MIIRVYETGNLDLMTVGDMLWNADKQANFHPHASWIHSSRFNTDQPDQPEGETSSRHYREFAVKWIGRESVIMWLTSNQILFEVVSYNILPEEEEAIEHSLDRDDSPPHHLN